MSKTSTKSHVDILVYFVGIIAWFIPGGGHLLYKRWSRGITMLVVISVTYLLGLMLGGLEMIDPKVPWYYAQIIAGGPTILATLVQNPDVTSAEIYGRGVDLGQLYAGVAGLLNLLCIFDALVLNQVEPSVSSDTQS